MKNGFARESLPNGNIVIYSPDGSARAFILNGISKDIFMHIEEGQSLDSFSQKSLSAVLKAFANEKLIENKELNKYGLAETTEQGEIFGKFPSQPFSDTLDSLGFWIHVTDSCNLRCSYCYASKSKNTISQAIADKFIETVSQDCSRLNIKSVSIKFAGGEPLTAFPIVIYIARQIKKTLSSQGVSVRFSIISNGTLVTRDIARDLKEVGISNIMISLDGIGEWNSSRLFISGKPSDQAVFRGINNLLEEGIFPHILSVLSNKNAEGLHILWDYVAKHNLSLNINLSREYDSQHGPALDSNLMKKVFLPQITDLINYPLHQQPTVSFNGTTFLGKRNMSCGAGYNYFGLTPKGGISTCQMTIDTPIDTLQNKDSIIDLSTPKSAPPSKCIKCVWRYVCVGGCEILALKAGKKNQPSIFCDLLLEIYPLFLILEGQKIERRMLLSSKSENLNESI